MAASNIWPMPSTQFPRFTLFQTRLHPFGSCLCLWDFTVATITSTHRFWISRMSPPLSKQNLSWTGNQSDLILSCGFSLYNIFRLTQRASLYNVLNAYSLRISTNTDSKTPVMDIDWTSIRYFRAESMSNRYWSEGLCYIQNIVIRETSSWSRILFRVTGV